MSSSSSLSFCGSENESYVPSEQYETESDLEDVSNATPSTSQTAKRKTRPLKEKAVKKQKTSSKSNKSKFSDFFNIISEDGNEVFGLCTLCKSKKVKIKMKNRNTSGLRKHLLAMHKNEAQQVFPMKHPVCPEGGIARFFEQTGKSIQVSDYHILKDKSATKFLSSGVFI